MNKHFNKLGLLLICSFSCLTFSLAISNIKETKASEISDNYIETAVELLGLDINYDNYSTYRAQINKLYDEYQKYDYSDQDLINEYNPTLVDSFNELNDLVNTYYNSDYFIDQVDHILVDDEEDVNREAYNLYSSYFKEATLILDDSYDEDIIMDAYEKYDVISGPFFSYNDIQPLVNALIMNQNITGQCNDICPGDSKTYYECAKEAYQVVASDSELLDLFNSSEYDDERARFEAWLLSHGETYSLKDSDYIKLAIRNTHKDNGVPIGVIATIVSIAICILLIIITIFILRKRKLNK